MPIFKHKLIRSASPLMCHKAAGGPKALLESKVEAHLMRQEDQAEFVHTLFVVRTTVSSQPTLRQVSGSSNQTQSSRDNGKQMLLSVCGRERTTRRRTAAFSWAENGKANRKK